MQVTNTAFVLANNRDFENWPLNTEPLYTGSTVVIFTGMVVELSNFSG